MTDQRDGSGVLDERAGTEAGDAVLAGEAGELAQQTAADSHPLVRIGDLGSDLGARWVGRRSEVMRGADEGAVVECSDGLVALVVDGCKVGKHAGRDGSDR